MGLWLWVCRCGFVVAWVCGYGFVVDRWWLCAVWWVCGYGGCRWWLCAVCAGFTGMVVAGGGSLQCVVVYGVDFRFCSGFDGWVSILWVCGYGFVGVGLWIWVCWHGFVVDRWWLCAVCGGFVGMVVVGGGSVQCVVSLRVWWLSVVALCSVWWFAVWVCGYGGCGFAVDPRPCLGNSHSLP
ncbi:hypothetical protein FCV25MIE_29106 [Fagus crenata]